MDNCGIVYILIMIGKYDITSFSLYSVLSDPLNPVYS